MKEPVTPESEIQKSIVNYLNSKRIFFYRNNSGGMMGHYKGKDRFVQFGYPGSPDIVAVISGRYTGIEVKAKTGKQSCYQRAFEQNLTNAGGRYILAKCSGDVTRLI